MNVFEYKKNTIWLACLSFLCTVALVPYFACAQITSHAVSVSNNTGNQSSGGEAGAPGEAGEAGTNGRDGEDGQAGKDGADGSVVTTGSSQHSLVSTTIDDVTIEYVSSSSGTTTPTVVRYIEVTDTAAAENTTEERLQFLLEKLLALKAFLLHYANTLL